MAAGDSKVSICNIGLIALGEPPITSLDDNRKAAIYCKARYDQVRRQILRAGFWNFARKQSQLAEVTSAPLFDWSNGFELPADFVRLYRMQKNPQSAYEIQGQLLLSNETAPLNIVYIYDHEDPTKFDPIFVAALGYAMGVELAMPITQSKSKRDDCKSAVEGHLGMARFAGAQEASPEEWDTDIMLQSRA